MATVTIDDKNLSDIANAIRNKNETTTTYKPSEMANAINQINTDGDTTIEDGIITRTITEYTNDRITYIGKYAIRECRNLTTVSLPNVTTIDIYGFQACEKLTTINLPEVTTINNYAFEYCVALDNVVLPKTTTILAFAFSNCYALKTIDLHKITRLEGYLFAYSRLLDTLIIRTETVCQLVNTSAFNSTPIASGTGYVYVPDDLAESYKSATNWSVYASQIKGISELGE